MSKVPSKISSRNNKNTVLFLGEIYNVQTRQTEGGGEHYKVELVGNNLISWDRVINDKYVTNLKKGSVHINIDNNSNKCVVRAKSINLLKSTVTQIINSIENYYRNFVGKQLSRYRLTPSRNVDQPSSYTIVLNDSCDKDTLFDLFGAVCESVEFTNDKTLLITYDSTNDILVNLRLVKLINDGCIEEHKKRDSPRKEAAKYADTVIFRGEEKIIISGIYNEELLYSTTIHISLTDSQVAQINKLLPAKFKETESNVKIHADNSTLTIFASAVDDIKNNISLIESDVDYIICSDLHHEYTTKPIHVSKLNDATRCGCKFLEQDTTNNKNNKTNRNNKSPKTYFNIEFDKAFCERKLKGGSKKTKRIARQNKKQSKKRN